MIAYVSIGNSDDKLAQHDWACFVADVTLILHRHNVRFHGSWFSEPASMWQNACFCIELPDVLAGPLKQDLAAMARKYHQDSIAWAEAPETEFL